MRQYALHNNKPLSTAGWDVFLSIIAQLLVTAPCCRSYRLFDIARSHCRSGTLCPNKLSRQSSLQKQTTLCSD